VIDDIFVPLVFIVLSELGDKTQLSILLLSSKTKKYWHLLAGIILAFIIVDGVAILAGEWLANIVPTRIVKISAAVIFIIVGIFILLFDKERTKTNLQIKNPFYFGFGLVFLAEWGDKTQIASGLFATKYNGFMVFIGVMLALTIVSSATVFLSTYISNFLKEKTLNRIVGILFILIGFSFLFI